MVGPNEACRAVVAAPACRVRGEVPMSGKTAGRRRVLVLAALSGVLLTACGSIAGSTAASSKDDLAIEPASFDLAVGPSARFIAGILTVDHRLVAYGSVDMRFSFLGAKDGSRPSPPGPVQRASYLPLPGTDVSSSPPASPAIVTASQTRGVYATEASFDRAGFWQVEVGATIAGRSTRATGAFSVGARRTVPAPGEPALATEGLTLSSTDAPKAAIDSRAANAEVPDPELHRTTIAAALAAHRPLVAVFSTPVYCVSRFCGPVTDMVQALSHDFADRASFVHVEIWRDFQNQVVNPEAATWLQRDGDINEPWVFVIGADGRIIARFDNVATRGELEPLLRGLPVIGAAT